VIDGCARWAVIIVTTGPASTQSCLDRHARPCSPRRSSPQAAILPHCRVLVSHAGAGTMLGALCHGLPQLCLPQGTDQPSNTAALLPTEPALAPQPDEITPTGWPPRSADSFTRVPSGEAALRVSAEIDYMPAPSTVLDELLPIVTAPEATERRLVLEHQAAVHLPGKAASACGGVTSAPITNAVARTRRRAAVHFPIVDRQVGPPVGLKGLPALALRGESREPCRAGGKPRVEYANHHKRRGARLGIDLVPPGARCGHARRGALRRRGCRGSCVPPSRTRRCR
jgi:EryCIII-like glycosyltransferase